MPRMIVGNDARLSVRFPSEDKEVDTFVHEDGIAKGDLDENLCSFASSGHQFSLHDLDEAWNDRAADAMKEKVRKVLTKPTYNVQDYYRRHGLFQLIARSAVFENMTLCIISINAIWMAVDTDYNLADTLVTSRPEFQVMEHLFCLFFSFEWFVRFMSFERKSKCIKDGWFVFDSLLVALMVMETWVMSAVLLVDTGSGKSPLSNASTLRLFRLLRLSRLVRMLRSLPELMILVKGMISALKSVFAVMCLLVLFMYVFAIAMTQLTSTTSVGEEFFPSVSESMFTLMVYATFLQDTTMLWDALAPESPLGLIVFFLFTMLAAYTILNMLIGVLCEVVSAVALIERDAASRSFVTDQLHNIVRTLDVDYDGRIDRGEFLQVLNDPTAVRALETVGVDPVGMVDVADYIFDSVEDKASLTFREFMDVVLGLRGTNLATKRDIIDLQKFVVHSMDSLQANFTNSLHSGKFGRSKINPRRSSGLSMTSKRTFPSKTSRNSLHLNEEKNGSDRAQCRPSLPNSAMPEDELDVSRWKSEPSIAYHAGYKSKISFAAECKAAERMLPSQPLSAWLPDDEADVSRWKFEPSIANQADHTSNSSVAADCTAAEGTLPSRPLPAWLARELQAMEQRTASMEELVAGLAAEVRLLAAAALKPRVAVAPQLSASVEEPGAQVGSPAAIPSIVVVVSGDRVTQVHLDDLPLPPPPPAPHTPCNTPPPTARGASSTDGASGVAAESSATVPVVMPLVALSPASDMLSASPAATAPLSVPTRAASGVPAGVLGVLTPRTPRGESLTVRSHSECESGFANWPLRLRRGSRQNSHASRISAVVVTPNSEPTVPVGHAGALAWSLERRMLPPVSRPKANSAGGIEVTRGLLHSDSSKEEPSERTEASLAAMKAELQLLELPSLVRTQDAPVIREFTCAEDGVLAEMPQRPSQPGGRGVGRRGETWRVLLEEVRRGTAEALAEA